MKKEIKYKGRFLNLINQEGWEYVERSNISGVVAIVAITGDEKIILVEQYRKPAGAHVIELPAGLAGDIPGEEHEALSVAAQRELLEETGYEAELMTYLREGLPSAGLTSENVTFFKAEKLKKVGQGGGDESESIVIHEVPLSDLSNWLTKKEKEGAKVAATLYAGIGLISKLMNQ